MDCNRKTLIQLLSQESLMLMLSDNPTIRQIQLTELVEKSKRILIQLTSPVVVYDWDIEQWHADCSMYGKNMTGYDYNPPVTRRGRFSNFRQINMEFE